MQKGHYWNGLFVYPSYLETSEKCWRGSQRKAKTGEKAEFTRVNEHFEPVFNAALATQVIFQRFRFRS
ncbi:hypothetical protein [Cellvibrio sp. PSBB006]|uniref:hypothetical protein n=1 Tax=Cellvibrio sp. PSBB006 TaxID=1987723 RepID=UPI0012F72446|nr:hypothetical protein [Cellvibrio sp. PSBB006]